MSYATVDAPRRRTTTTRTTAVFSSLLLAVASRPCDCFVAVAPAASRPFASSSFALGSLKPGAVPLMDAGKALARGGELLVDATNALGVYGGSLSAAGASVRNAGDCVAQAAASCRFKTATEVVIDELREAAVCLDEASRRLDKAGTEEFEAHQRQEKDDTALSTAFGALARGCVAPTRASHLAAEAAGAALMRRAPVTVVGTRLVEASDGLGGLSAGLASMARDGTTATTVEPSLEEASERIKYAADKMREAGERLAGTYEAPKTAGKGWLKGGSGGAP